MQTKCKTLVISASVVGCYNNDTVPANRDAERDTDRWVHLHGCLVLYSNCSYVQWVLRGSFHYLEASSILQAAQPSLLSCMGLYFACMGSQDPNLNY